MASTPRSSHRITDYLLGLSVLIVSGAFIFPAARFIQPAHTPAMFSGTFVPVTDVGQVPRGGSLVVSYASRPWILLKADGDIEALSGSCTYRGTELTWDQERGLLVCSGHGCTYDRHGNVLAGLATAPLESLLVHIVNGRIHIARRPI